MASFDDTAMYVWGILYLVGKVSQQFSQLQ